MWGFSGLRFHAFFQSHSKCFHKNLNDWKNHYFDPSDQWNKVKYLRHVWNHHIFQNFRLKQSKIRVGLLWLYKDLYFPFQLLENEEFTCLRSGCMTIIISMFLKLLTQISLTIGDMENSWHVSNIDNVSRYQNNDSVWFLQHSDAANSI